MRCYVSKPTREKKCQFNEYSHCVWSMKRSAIYIRNCFDHRFNRLCIQLLSWLIWNISRFFPCISPCLKSNNAEYVVIYDFRLDFFASISSFCQFLFYIWLIHASPSFSERNIEFSLRSKPFACVCNFLWTL